MTSTTSPEGLALLVCDRSFDRQHAAFMLAATGLAMNRPVILFATGSGVLSLCRSLPWEQEELEAARQGIATLATLREALVSMDARLLACETGLRRMGIAETDLLDSVEIVGMPTFLDLSAGCRILAF